MLLLAVHLSEPRFRQIAVLLDRDFGQSPQESFGVLRGSLSGAAQEPRCQGLLPGETIDARPEGSRLDSGKERPGGVQGNYQEDEEGQQILLARTVPRGADYE